MLTEYNVLQEQNIFDLVCNFYNLDNTYVFIQQNPNIGSIDFDFSTVSNVSVVYDTTLVVAAPSEIPVQQQNQPSSIAQIKALEQQNIFDMVIMTYGSIDSTYKLIQDNGIGSINNQYVARKIFTYDKDLVVDGILYNHIYSNNIVVATGANNTNKSHDRSFNQFSFN